MNRTYGRTIWDSGPLRKPRKTQETENTRLGRETWDTNWRAGPVVMVGIVFLIGFYFGRRHTSS